MSDTAAQHGVEVDPEALERALGVPVRAVTGGRGAGLAVLRDVFAALPEMAPPPPRRWKLPELAEREVEELSGLLQRHEGLPPAPAFAEAVALLGGIADDGPGAASAAAAAHLSRWSAPVREHVARDLAVLHAAGIDLPTETAEARYAEVERIARQAARRASRAPAVTLSDKLDRVFLHRIWGYLIFLGLMYVVFQAMFSWAGYPQGWIEDGVNTVGGFVESRMPEGDLRDLLVNGVIAGVGNTIVFLPQILLLFLFISLLEDTGYLARAAFLMDRLMSRVGLHGKSFIPLLSSNACAIPGIMATRTIESPRARLLTILVAPLMSCSARLPVYALMIGAFIPHTTVFGIFTLPALTLLAMYALGTAAAFGMAAVFNHTLLRGTSPSFLLEMPPYRWPSLRTVALQMAERAWLFLRRAGTVILAITVVLWFLASYPKAPEGTPRGEQTGARSPARWGARSSR
jgi:ferrous iron transport protein B